MGDQVMGNIKVYLTPFNLLRPAFNLSQRLYCIKLGVKTAILKALPGKIQKRRSLVIENKGSNSRNPFISQPNIFKSRPEIFGDYLLVSPLPAGFSDKNRKFFTDSQTAQQFKLPLIGAYAAAAGSQRRPAEIGIG